MNKLSLAHYFIAGVFVAAALSATLWLAVVLAIMLIALWGNVTLPLVFALLVDVSFVDVRELANLYGLVLTFGVIILATILLPLRKFLKV